MGERPPPSAATGTVEVSCAFDGPPEPIFDAFLEPATARRWLFAPEGGEASRIELDARPEGAFLVATSGPAGETTYRGRYRAIERPVHIAFTLSGPPLGPDETEVAVTVMALGEWQVVALIHRGVPQAAAADIEAWWNRMFDRLAVVLAEGGEAPSVVP